MMSQDKSQNNSKRLSSPESQIIQKSNKNAPSRNSAFLSPKDEIVQQGKVTFKDSRYK